MTIQVQCPNGCSFSVPSSRKGKMVLCGECSASVRIPRSAENVDGNIVFRALLIADAEDLPEVESENQPSNGVQPNSTSLEPSKLIEPPQRTRSNRKPRGSASSEASNPFDFLAKEKIADAEISGNGFAVELDTVSPESDEAADVVIEMDREPAYTLVEDRQWLTRFYGVCLLIIGLINTVPVIAMWIAYSEQLAESAWPRWAFVTLFVSAVFMIYAVYLIQLADWSSLVVVTLFSLYVACSYGFIAGALWLGKSTDPIAAWLQVPQAYYQFAPIWGGIMFCLMSLACFTFGRDAIAWQRSDKLKLIHA